MFHLHLIVIHLYKSGIVIVFIDVRYDEIAVMYGAAAIAVEIAVMYM